MRSLKETAMLVLSIDEKQGGLGGDKGADFIKALIPFMMSFVLTRPTQSGTKLRGFKVS